MRVKKPAKRNMKDDAVQNSVDNAPHSVFSRIQKGTYVYISSLAAFASPVSSSIYYPAMTTLATDLHVSLTDISLTITTYMARLRQVYVYVYGANSRRSSKV